MALQRTDRILWYALSGLALLRILMVIGFLNDMPHITHSGWQFITGGGDQRIYFSMAQSFAALQPVEGLYPIGFPALLTPLVIMVQPAVWQDLIKPVLLLHTLLALISIYLVGYITHAVTKNTAVSVLSALAWTVTPYVMYGAAGFFDTAWLRNTYVSYLMWFAMLSEPSTSFFLLLSIYCYVLSFNSSRLLVRRGGAWLAGAAAGMTICIRMPSALYAVIFAAGYLLQRRYRQALAFSGAVVVLLIPQMLYNYIFYSSVFSSGYTPALANREVLYAYAYAQQFITYLAAKHPVICWTALVMAVVMPAVIFYRCVFQRFYWAVLISVVYIHMLFYTGWWGFKDDFIRFTMPVVPVAVIVGAGFIAALLKWTKPHNDTVAEGARP